ncbi:hypothetical protein [Micromonospora siamensis]|uniref:Uncharacterized protein n=1 Tax=Micromonospora siamensis TaxID=299152 RepID=A0A1C5GY91_9ACTN|nr:hypothetical protein [Micromonospora siamensis]SCG38789.1 hypothetical protein GA0074704_0729 [Micromonospora siamensis]
MSYPEVAPARRPAAVTLAAAVLALMVAGALAYAVTALAVLGGTVDRFRTAAGATTARPDEVDTVVALVSGSAVLSAVVTVLAALLLVGLAVGLLAGRRGARTATWVVCGLGLLCGCCSVAAVVGQRAAPLRLGGGRVSGELLGLVAEAYPSWWIPVNAGLSVAQALGYVVVAALLAVPAANAWFGGRRAPAGPPVTPPFPPR